MTYGVSSYVLEVRGLPAERYNRFEHALAGGLRRQAHFAARGYTIPGFKVFFLSSMITNGRHPRRLVLEATTNQAPGNTAILLKESNR